MDKCIKCLNRKNCIDGANYKTAEKCNKYRPEPVPEWKKKLYRSFVRR
jgi:hypothetical protein